MKTLITFLLTAITTSAWWAWAIYCPTTKPETPVSPLAWLIVPALGGSLVLAILLAVEISESEWK